MSEIIDIAKLLKSQGPLFLVLIGILYGSYKQVWVWGFQLKKAEEKSAKWESMALQLAGVAEASVNIVKRREEEK